MIKKIYRYISSNFINKEKISYETYRDIRKEYEDLKGQYEDYLKKINEKDIYKKEDFSYLEPLLEKIDKISDLKYLDSRESNVKKVKKILTDENKYKNDGCDFCINAEQTYQTGYIHTLCYYNFCTRKNRNNLCSDFISENELLKEDRQENIFNNYRKIRIKYENMMFNNINLNKYHNRYYEEFSDDTSINFISMYY